MAAKTIFIALLGAAVCAGEAGGQEPPAEGKVATPPSVVREKVREWVRAQKTLGEEAAAWEEEKRTMGELNALRKKEIGEIEAVIEAAGSRLADAEKRMGELEGEEATLRGGRVEMEKRVAILEEALRPQVAMFPPPLMVKVGDAVSRLENPEADTPLQNRFRDVLVILGAAGQFHGSVTVDTEVREYGDERVEVEVFYLGFAGAWYVDRTGKRAGSGKPGAGGWEWEEDGAVARRVREAIAMHRRTEAPGFVALPFGGKKEGEGR